MVGLALHIVPDYFQFPIFVMIVVSEIFGSSITKSSFSYFLYLSCTLTRISCWFYSSSYAYLSCSFVTSNNVPLNLGESIDYKITTAFWLAIVFTNLMDDLTTEDWSDDDFEFLESTKLLNMLNLANFRKQPSNVNYNQSEDDVTSAPTGYGWRIQKYGMPCSLASVYTHIYIPNLPHFIRKNMLN